MTDTAQATDSQLFSLTINPAAQIQSLSPSTANAGLRLKVSITGSYTHFVQGTTQASFGPGISVGGAAAGQPGLVTVTSPTAATAEIRISASAATGSQTVMATTGTEQVSLPNGFTIAAAVPFITVTTTRTTPLNPGFSGVDDEYLINGVEYWDPKYIAAVQPLKFGFIRFPGGIESVAFDWQAGHLNTTWMNELKPKVNSFVWDSLSYSLVLSQAKGGAQFSDYATFLHTLGTNGLVVLNGYTDTNTDSAGKMVNAAQTLGINVLEWELGNEPYCCPLIFSTSTAYANAQYNPLLSEFDLGGSERDRWSVPAGTILRIHEQQSTVGYRYRNLCEPVLASSKLPLLPNYKRQHWYGRRGTATERHSGPRHDRVLQLVYRATDRLHHAGFH